ncbi:MAG: hypothetical protein ICV65_03765 [Flavisolibacter sp.]|nr:hypothetical protein [Flavisolibacter sp.]
MRICLLLSFLITSFIIHAQQNRKIESTNEIVNIQTKAPNSNCCFLIYRMTFATFAALKIDNGRKK